jgi:hypothetical protein
MTGLALYLMTGFTPDVSQGTLVRNRSPAGLRHRFRLVPLSTVAFGTLAPVLRTQGTGSLQSDAQYRSKHWHIHDELSAGAQFRYYTGRSY